MRMRQPTAGLRDARTSGPSPPRAISNGISEPAAPGRDPQLGHIFRNMRTATRLSREALARRLATSPATIDDFETGAILSLPHWRETVRIVRTYCEILRLDPEPILRRIQNHLRAAGTYEDPPTRSDPAPGPPPALLRKDRVKSQSPPPRRSGRSARRLFALSAPLVLLVGAFYLVQAAPGPIYRAVALLPAPLEGAARAGLDRLLLYSAPRRDGLRWIDVGDPRLRKVDKLQTSTR